MQPVPAARSALESQSQSQSQSQSESDTDLNSDAEPKAPPDQELTPMEHFLDNLFNEHMVLPQPPEDAPPPESKDD